jgi:transcriptional regulator with XRE-family HTH domain
MVLDAGTQLTLTPLALQKARERAGLTQEELAARCPISLPAIQSYERPGHPPNYSYLLTLLEAYGLDLRGFHDLLIEVRTDLGHAELQQRIARMEARLDGLQNASGMQVSGAEDRSSAY